MGPLLLGVVAVLLAWFLPWPGPLNLILYVIGFVLIVYGLYLLFVGSSGASGPRRRWW